MNIYDELKELRRLWEQNEKLNVETATRVDKIEKVIKAEVSHAEDVMRFAETGAVKIKLSMQGEEIESFLTGHAVNWKRVNAGIEIIATPQRVFQIACKWTDYRRERAEKTDPHRVQKAILTFCEAIEADRGLYDGWKANIAAAIIHTLTNPDAVAFEDNESFAKVCAERFLKTLLPPNKGTSGRFAADVRAMSGGDFTNRQVLGGSQQVRQPAEDGNGDTATGQWLNHGKKYWIIPEEFIGVTEAYPGQIHALYSGDGIFLYNGREVRMARGSKAETR